MLSSATMDIQELDSHLLPEGSTHLHIAANNKDTSLLSSILLDTNPHQLQDIINKLDNHGRTPLGVALQFGRIEAAAILVREGGDLSVKTSKTCNNRLAEVLEWPAYRPLLIMLVNEGVKLAPDASFLQKLLHVAVQEGDEYLLHTLLDRYEVNVDCKDQLGSSSLHYASLAGHTSIAQLLLKYGASMTLQDWTGRTALHIASARGHLNLLHLFLQSDLATSEPDKVLSLLDLSRRTCAHVALYCKQYDALGYLLNHFKNYLDLKTHDIYGHTLPGLLYYCRFKSELIPCSSWLSLPLLSAEESTWVLHHAVNRGDMTLLQHSLASGNADINCFDFMNLSPLMWACRLGHKEICRALVEAGAELNSENHLRITALHFACSNDHFHVAEYLFSLQGMDPTSFFDTFSRPLSLHLLEIIMSYYAANISAQKPAHWPKWLSLAARNPQMTQVEFSKLVDTICPYDWLQLLINSDYTYIPTCCKKQNHSYLSHYIKEGTGTMKFKKMTSKSSSKKPKRLFTEGSIKPVIYYPVHEAALCGNVSVLDFFFETARAESKKLITQLMFEVKNECKGTVVELMAKKYSQFAHRLDGSVVDEIKKRKIFKLPSSLSYEQAVMHYLMVSHNPGIVVHRSTNLYTFTMPSLTPLDTW